MNRIWRTLRDYILWSYERGTIQYDVMVTLILLFVFFSPYWINFKDKPIIRYPHRSQVVVVSDGAGRLIFQIDSAAVHGTQDSELRADLLRVIEPISGEVIISDYEPERDRTGQITSYKVWAHR